MEHNGQVGDIVVLASDGLWDNLNNLQVVAIVNSFLKENAGHLGDKTNELAQKIAIEAEKYSKTEK